MLVWDVEIFLKSHREVNSFVVMDADVIGIKDELLEVDSIIASDDADTNKVNVKLISVVLIIKMVALLAFAIVDSSVKYWCV